MPDFRFVACLMLCAAAVSAGAAEKCVGWPAYDRTHNIDVAAHSPLGAAPTAGASCSAQQAGKFTMPDPACTPGAVNPTVTGEILKDPQFHTCLLRDRATSAQTKATTYDSYGISHPSGNEGANQVCELDHFVPLELGGADTLDNIWPQCGPDNVARYQRYFPQKDKVETFLAEMVKAGKADLAGAQRCIARDWSAYLPQAAKACRPTGAHGMLQCDLSAVDPLDTGGC